MQRQPPSIIRPPPPLSGTQICSFRDAVVQVPELSESGPFRELDSLFKQQAMTAALESAGTDARCAGLGRHIKCRLVQLGVEIEDAESAQSVLETAISKEAAEFDSAMSSAIDEYKSKYGQRCRAQHKALNELLGRVDGLVRRKEQLSAECKAAVGHAKAAAQRTEALARRLSSEHRARAAALKADWDRGAASRRRAFAATKTEEIRGMTVRGLEPEVRRLTSAHAADLERVEAERIAELEVAATEAEAALQADIVRARDSGRVRFSELEASERSCFAERDALAQAEQRDRYATAVADRAEAAAELRRDLESRAAADRARRAAEVEATRRRSSDQLEAAEARARNERATRRAELDRALIVVGQARQADRHAWQAALEAEYHESIETELRAAKRSLEAKRDADIHANITRSQAEALERETQDREVADQELTQIRAEHLDKAATLRDARTQWVDRRCEALANCAALKKQLDKLKEMRQNLFNQKTALDAHLAPARQKSVTCDRELQSKLDGESRSRAVDLANLESDERAARAVADALKLHLVSFDRDHNKALHVLDEKLRADLDTIDVKAKTEIQHLETLTFQITQELDTDELRADHLATLLKGYDRACPLQRRPSPSSSDNKLLQRASRVSSNSTAYRAGATSRMHQLPSRSANSSITRQ